MTCMSSIRALTLTLTYIPISRATLVVLWITEEGYPSHNRGNKNWIIKAAPRVNWLVLTKCLIWFCGKILMESQGFNENKSILYQYNNSTILLEWNGKRSSIKRTQYIIFCFDISYLEWECRGWILSHYKNDCGLYEKTAPNKIFSKT